MECAKLVMQRNALQNLCNTTLLALPTKARILCLDSL
jgi:hypothetical protein